ncbi:hypothetical protein R80B4_00100 [Fibrobacteres bacterium R8-0-B4]
MPKMTKAMIESIHRKYHNLDYLIKDEDTDPKDPLVVVRKFSDAASREAVGLISAALAYGRVKMIVRSINRLIYGVMEGAPVAFVRDVSYTEKRRRLAGFKHRLDDGEVIAALTEAMNLVIGRYGSLGNCFKECWVRSGKGNDCGEALTLFTDELKRVLKEDKAIRGVVPARFKALISSPANGSACKRMALYLRWMVRKDDKIDLGVWKGVPASILIVPVDTNVRQIAQYYGFTSRATVNWRMAEEITEALRKFDPDDPVRFDFSLCHAWMDGYRG